MKREAYQNGGPEDWLFSNQVAQMLGLSERNVTIQMRQGAIPGKKIGGRWGVLRKDLTAFLRVKYISVRHNLSDYVEV